MFKKFALGISTLTLALGLSACNTTEIDDTEELTIDENKVETVELERKDKIKANDTLTFDEKVTYLGLIDSGLEYLKVYADIGTSGNWRDKEIQNVAKDASQATYDIILLLQEKYDNSTGERQQALEYLILYHLALDEFHTDLAYGNFSDSQDYFTKAEETARLMNEYSELYFEVIE